MLNRPWRAAAAASALLLLAGPPRDSGCGGSGVLLAEAAYFHVQEGEEKCFVEHTPEHQVLTVKYRHQDNPGVPCMLIFKDPRQAQVFSKRVGPEDQEQGKTAYMSQKNGEHKICVKCEGSRWTQTRPLKWEIHVDMGDTEFSTSPATRKEFSGVHRTVLSTLARSEAIMAENEYEKSAEMEFRNTSERMNSNVVIVSVFIIAIEAGLVIWQIWHMRTFFRREKLI